MERALDTLFEIKVSFLAWTMSFLGIVAIRVFIERMVSVSTALAGRQILIEYVHNVLFFSLLFIFLWLIISLVLRINPKKLSSLMLWGTWLVVFPPVIDMIRTSGRVFWSFYVLDNAGGLWKNFITIFGALPSGITYFGTKIIFIITLLLILGVVYIRSKSITRAAAAAFFGYVAIFFMGSFPSWFAYGYFFLEKSKNMVEIQGFMIARMFASSSNVFGVSLNDLAYSFAYNISLVYFLLLLLLVGILSASFHREKFMAVLYNARFSQLVYNAGLFCVGLFLGFYAYPEHFAWHLFSFVGALDLLLSIWLAWEASIIINDVYDLRIDEVSNRKRPLPMKVFELDEYFNLGIFFFILSLLGGLAIGIKFAVILALYQFLAWTYSARPYRLKRLPGVATFVSSLASLLVMIMGFLIVSGDQNLAGLSWRVIMLIIVSLTLSLSIKDFKDKEGDKKEGIWTIPVVFGEQKARMVVASGVFISFVSSGFFLNEKRLFGWSLLFGGMAFLVVMYAKRKVLCSTRLFWWILGIVGAYGLILARIVFIS